MSSLQSDVLVGKPARQGRPAQRFTSLKSVFWGSKTPKTSLHCALRCGLALLLLVPLLAQHFGGASRLPKGNIAVTIQVKETVLKDREPCRTQLDIFRYSHLQNQRLPQTQLESKLFAKGLLQEGIAPVQCSGTKPAVHVQYSTDPSEYVAMLASIQSALRNAEDPGRLRFHLTIPFSADERELCTRLISGLQSPFRPVPPALASAFISGAGRKNPLHICLAASVPSYTPPGVTIRQCMSSDYTGVPGPAVPTVDSCFCWTPQFHIVRFNPLNFNLPTRDAMGGHKNDRQALLNPLNFARNYADSYLLPVGVEKVVYLDADTIVQGDIAQLWETPLGEGKVAGVARSCKIRMQQLFDFKKELVRSSMQKDSCYINAGVYVVDLRRYQQMGIQRRIGELIELHSKSRLWLQGVQQPSFVLAIVKHSVDVDPRWNQDSLGYNPKKKRLDSCTLRSAYVLHWNGVYKPWKCNPDQNCYQAYWEPYQLE